LEFNSITTTNYNTSGMVLYHCITAKLLHNNAILPRSSFVPPVERFPAHELAHAMSRFSNIPFMP